MKHEFSGLATSTGGDVLLVVVALGTYPVEELTARAKIKDEVQVVRGLQDDPAP